MAVLTAAQQKAIAKQVGDYLYLTLKQLPAARSVTDLVAMVGKVDAVMEATATQINTLYNGISMESVFLQHIRTAVADATVQEAGLCLAYWSMKRSGLS